MRSLETTTVVSGGQTGVDRAALDVAIERGMNHGGWCPKGRRAEDGVIPDRYRLQETESADYALRTERNVVDSDGTLIFHRGPLRGGTRLTARLAEKHGKPIYRVDFEDQRVAPSNVADWIISRNLKKLNVAGPRASNDPEIYKQTRLFLEILFNC